ncbi:hypothetical protein E4U60_000330 [Claviceps pazoutovae]|uniref:Uncharacterized protein n=1 Tax=Claviceps pazoutovae TaxID=1649127 RepID=A0A9P7SAP4_9HYPO|nr:hypothetical protein E4U60_000330 [Claviceps pazoutovae]
MSATIKHPANIDVFDGTEDAGRWLKDLVVLQDALTDRFTVHLVGEKIPVGTNVEIRQRDDEPLDAYHSRVLTVLRRAGGRDKPLTPENTPLTPLEVHTLEGFIHRFVRGLRDKSLMQEAISRDVLSADSLRSATELVKRALGFQESKAEFARYAAQDAKICLMEEYIRRQSGVSANEELSRAYILSSRNTDQ